jgi:predicted AAA+ superfamily ATPase
MKRHVFLNYIKALRERIDSRNGLVQVILGPMQVGKTATTLKLLEEQGV